MKYSLIALLLLLLLWVSKAQALVCDGATDTSAALQTLIDNACATDPPGVIYIPSIPGLSCVISKPIILDCNRIHLAGAGMYSSYLKPVTRGEWAINYIPSSVPAFPITTALVTGSNGAWNMTGGFNEPWLELKDLGDYGDMQGYGAYTVEAHVKLTNTNTGCLVSSGTQLHSTDNVQGALELCINGTGHWFATVTTTVGGLHTATEGAAATTGSTRWIAASYDGSNLRLFDAVPNTAGTTAVATTAVTGTIVQNPWESFTLGRRAALAYEASNSLPPITGVVDNFRLSNIARYTGSSFTSPATTSLLACDTNCLAGWSGSTYHGGDIVIMNTRDGGSTAYLTPRDYTFYEQDDIITSDLGIINGGPGANASKSFLRATHGIFDRNTIDGAIQNVEIGRLSNIGQGIYLFNNSFGTTVEHVRIDFQGWFGYAANLAIGYQHVYSLFTQGGPGPGMIQTQGTSCDFHGYQELINSVAVNQAWFVGTPGSVFDSCVIEGAAWDTESAALIGGEWPYTAGLVDFNYNGLTFIGGEFETPNVPAVVADSLGTTGGPTPAGSLAYFNPGFDRPTQFPGTTPFFQFIGTPAQPVWLSNYHSPNKAPQSGFSAVAITGSTPFASFIFGQNN